MKLGLLVASSIFLTTSVQAETLPLADYLKSMDKTSVSFSGRIKYSSTDDAFTYYDSNRNPFGVTVDAGRETRERIEQECDNPSFMVSYDDLCKVEGVGSVEIRGSRIYISVAEITSLGK